MSAAAHFSAVERAWAAASVYATHITCGDLVASECVCMGGSHAFHLSDTMDSGTEFLAGETVHRTHSKHLSVPADVHVASDDLATSKQGVVPTDESWTWYSWDCSTAEPRYVHLANLPLAICSSKACIDAMFQQAGLQQFVLDTEILRRWGRPTGKVRVKLVSEMSALYCVKWFDGCVWQHAGSEAISAKIAPTERDGDEWSEQGASSHTLSVGEKCKAETCEEFQKLRDLAESVAVSLGLDDKIPETKQASETVGLSDSERSTTLKSDNVVETVDCVSEHEHLWISTRTSHSWADLSDKEDDIARFFQNM